MIGPSIHQADFIRNMGEIDEDTRILVIPETMCVPTYVPHVSGKICLVNTHPGGSVSYITQQGCYRAVLDNLVVE